MGRIYILFAAKLFLLMYYFQDLVHYAMLVDSCTPSWWVSIAVD
jgi:hypothetical protein